MDRLIYVPSLRAENAPDWLPGFVALFDPGVAPRDDARYIAPQGLPLGRPEARAALEELSRMVREAREPGELAARLMPGELSASLGGGQSLSSAEKEALDSFMAQDGGAVQQTASADPAPDQEVQDAQDAHRAQLALLLAWSLETTSRELASLSEKLAATGKAFSASLGLGDADMEEGEEAGILAGGFGLSPLATEADFAAVAVDPRLTLVSMLPFLTPGQGVATADPDLAAVWREAGVAFASVPQSQDGARLFASESGPVAAWKLLGFTSEPALEREKGWARTPLIPHLLEPNEP